MEFKPCSTSEIARLLPAARREGLYFSPSTCLYSAWVNNVMVGFSGIVWYKNHCKFKNDYIIEGERHKGYYSQMMLLKFNLVRQKGMAYVTATCTPAALPTWLNLGAVITKRYKIYTAVRREL